VLLAVSIWDVAVWIAAVIYTATLWWLREKEIEKNNCARLFLHSVKKPRPFLFRSQQDQNGRPLSFTCLASTTQMKTFFKIILTTSNCFVSDKKLVWQTKSCWSWPGTQLVSADLSRWELMAWNLCATLWERVDSAILRGGSYWVNDGRAELKLADKYSRLTTLSVTCVELPTRKSTSRCSRIFE
jgi:hypothetical protein